MHHEVGWVGWGRAVNNLHHFVAKEMWGEGPMGATSWLSTANGHSRFAAQSWPDGDGVVRRSERRSRWGE